MQNVVSLTIAKSASRNSIANGICVITCVAMYSRNPEFQEAGWRRLKANARAMSTQEPLPVRLSAYLSRWPSWSQSCCAS